MLHQTSRIRPYKCQKHSRIELVCEYVLKSHIPFRIGYSHYMRNIEILIIASGIEKNALLELRGF